MTARGPLSPARGTVHGQTVVLHLLPGGTWLHRIGDLARLYVGPALDVRVRPLLAASQVPPLQLVTARDDARRAPALLGWTTWLTSGPLTADRGDAAFPTT